MLKRIFDVFVALLVLAISSVFLIIIAVAIKLESKGEVIFRQERVTQGGRIFRIHKFRSMKKNDSNILLTTGDNDSRITKVGKFVRKLHLDELLQLIDVLKGDMSLVGPRPEVPKYTKYHKEKWAKVLKIKPGITGYGTLKCIEFEYKTLAASKNPEEDYINKVLPKKLDLEIEYIKKQSFLLDLKIIWWTVKRFLGFR